ncbi:hypothetical protein DOJK_00177 [Patescibacteria group bacterium]|nr:hypothetical protein DOJK_00177 [Patescibacteria group bacterium]
MARLVEDDKSLSLEDKLCWLLTDAFNSSLKEQIHYGSGLIILKK